MNCPKAGHAIWRSKRATIAQQKRQLPLLSHGEAFDEIDHLVSKRALGATAERACGGASDLGLS
jgi:hypothetical protein